MPPREFRVSVITAVHDVRDYLEEAVESVLAQSIGFAQHIQLILVDDGSTDGSGDICARYAAAYPENVVHLTSENRGVSAARNLGLARATGKVVNFLDADDRWEHDAFGKALEFLAQHPEVKLAAGRIRYFDAADGYHPLDRKFTSDRVVDIADDHRAPQLHMNSAFVRRASLPESPFDERLRVSEDFKLATTLIAEQGRYGLLKSAVYWLRSRPGADSATNRSMSHRWWYLDVPRFCHGELLALAAGGATASRFIQYSVMYDLQRRLRASSNPGVSGTDLDDYRSLIATLLRGIDDDVILEQPFLNAEHYLWAFALKRGISLDEMRRNVTVDKGIAYVDGRMIRDMKRDQRLHIEILEERDGEVLIEGSLTSILDDDRVCLHLRVAGQQVPVRLFERPELARRSLGAVILSPRGFTARLTVKDRITIKPMTEIADVVFEPAPVYGPHARLTETLLESYFTDGPLTFVRKGRQIVVLRDASAAWRLRRELKLLAEIVGRKNRPGAALFRLLAHATRMVNARRRVWLVSDRIMQAGDNGEAFFEYLMATRPKGIRPLFTLAKDSPDLPRLKRVGPVVMFGGLRYRLLMLTADMVVSASGDGHIPVTFGDDVTFYKDLQRFGIAFLQHGVTKDDLSEWLNRYRRNIRIFVTAGRPEYRSIIEGPYYYTEREVKLTGFPRHDRLLAEQVAAEDRIVIMPTWRKWLSGRFDPATGLRSSLAAFRESEYFGFYNGLLNHPRLLEELRARGFTMTFVLHPSLAQEASCFDAGPSVAVDAHADYFHEFKTARLLVTDYSSVAFDFALLDKPVVYAQFDKEMFESSHTYKPGYFTAERDGFGPVVRDLESTVHAVVASIVAGFVVEPEYVRRASDFFYRGERSNCENLYREILAARSRPSSGAG